MYNTLGKNLYEKLHNEIKTFKDGDNVINFKRVYTFIIATIIIIFIFGLLITLYDDQIARLLLTKNEEKYGVRTEWIGFWGSILGAFLQGIATAAGIFVSIQLFKKDKENNLNKELSQKEEVEKNNFISGFGKILSAYDMMIYLVNNYDDLNEYYEKQKFDDLERLALEINEGPITVRISLMQREISSYKRIREQGLIFYPSDTSYQDADGKIRRNMEHLKKLLISKREQHMKKFTEITGEDLSEEVIWDKGRTFVGYFSDEIKVGSKVNSKPEVQKNNE
jgi:hypothetical protein